MNTKRGVVALLPVIVIAILLIAVGGYFVYPSFMVQKKPSVTPSPYPSSPAEPTPITITEPTENWESYSNPIYNFAIGIPPGWEAAMNDCSDTETPPSNCYPTFELVDKSPIDYGLLITLRMGSDKGKSLEEIADEMYRGYQMGVSQWENPDDFVLKQTTFKNKKAYIITRIDTPSAIRELITLHKGRFYDFGWAMGNAENFDQILSTFKFTD
ncbi:hypothetical protein A2V56_02330 [Candidatus Woesebacteria bacterium RBG_19FT_COMBO_42_9]|uniref:PsbP C-terminal domain-containing protein n=1 Tax=Candidatus Woesebacteria bacterium RBG_16_42_24 TaxID=1802485 RepID=A0A1F7XL76_9BACT|nr:MAG: hypothetical protein A2V97_03150 [Candidatus Woesebacteria bacterium RBG_16_42_24]OGM16960.1 MAG: hypothetical protein A2V56_02330 [Candidatus Woesebacteria bacterium RBG_19FT_COMBO_42_9]OGM66753.1 MAG: hypothetical protein A2985_03610 [Candidatus Woesebacteria bacterium RIFCSPLOWO2_01_FULL_43_11]